MMGKGSRKEVDWDIERTAYTWIVLGDALLVNKSWKDAARAFRNSLAIRDDGCITWRKLGAALCNVVELEEAIEAYSQAVSLKDDYGTAWAEMGFVYKNLGNDDKAHEAFSKALEGGHAFGGSKVYFLVGEWLYRMGQLEEAIGALTQCIEIAPESYKAWFFLAKANAELQRYDAAWKAAEMVVEVNPNLAMGWLVYGELLPSQGGTFDEVEKAFIKAVELEPDLALGWYQLGTAYARQELPGKADEMFSKAISLDVALEEDVSEFYDSIR